MYQKLTLLSLIAVMMSGCIIVPGPRRYGRHPRPVVTTVRPPSPTTVTTVHPSTVTTRVRPPMPPKPRVRIPRRPSSSHVWTSGKWYWSSSRNKWVWKNGYWKAGKPKVKVIKPPTPPGVPAPRIILP